MFSNVIACLCSKVHHKRRREEWIGTSGAVQLSLRPKKTYKAAVLQTLEATTFTKIPLKMQIPVLLHSGTVQLRSFNGNWQLEWSWGFGKAYRDTCSERAAPATQHSITMLSCCTAQQSDFALHPSGAVTPPGQSEHQGHLLNGSPSIIC